MKSFLYCWAIFLSISAFSQSSLDLLTTSYRYGFPKNTIESPGEATETGVLINLKVPIVLSQKNIWYSDITYQRFHVDYSTDFPGTLNPTTIHGLIFQTGLVHQINEQNALQFLVVPRFMSDLNNVDSRHFQLGGIGMFEHKYSEQLTMRFGMLFNQELFGKMFVPLIYVDWDITDKWKMVGLLPIYAKVFYQANENLSIGFSHFGLITSFQVGDPAFDGDYIERQSIDLTLFARQRVWENIHLEARFGMAVGRAYTQYAKGDEMDFRISIATVGDERTQKNVLFDPGPIVDLRLVYNFVID